MTVTIDDVRQAAVQLEGLILRTPTIPAPVLSEQTGADVVLKLENLQVTGAFKARGAAIRLLSLNQEERDRGVVAASAGNHAQGVAYHAAKLGISALIVMPKNTPFTKVQRTESLGAQVKLFGEDFNAAGAHAQEISDSEGRTFVHPFDDPAVIAGQGTVSLELLKDVPNLKALIVPIGGGGLIAGMAIAAKAINPKIKIYGVQAALYPSMAQLMKGETPDGGGATVAEGIAVKKPGELTSAIIRRLVDDIFIVEEHEIEFAIQSYLENQRIVVEGAGAAPLAALIKNPEVFKGLKTGLIVSGGNIDSSLLSTVLMRGLVRGGRITSLRVKIVDRPGALAIVSSIIGDSGANILEVHHQRLFYDLPVKQTEMDVVVETMGTAHVQHLTTALSDAGFPARVLAGRST